MKITKQKTNINMNFELTNFWSTGNLKSLTNPKSSPVANILPECERRAQFTSQFSEFFGHIPITSFPSVLKK